MPNKQSSRKRTSRARSSRTQAPQLVNAWATTNRGPENKFYPFSFANQQLYHNVGAAMNNTGNLLDLITTGTSFAQKIGLSIKVKRLVAHLVFNNKVDRPNVSYRVICVAAPSTTSVDTFAELFSGGNFAGVHLPTNSVLLHDQTFPFNQGSGMDNNVTPNKERSFNHYMDVPINHTVIYNTDGLCQTRLTVWCICYDAHGTLTTDNIASLAQGSFRIDFVDP
jgi:hypothetical protein